MTNREEESNGSETVALKNHEILNSPYITLFFTKKEYTHHTHFLTQLV